MKRLNLTICVITLILSVAGTATADSWQVVYQTDFSSDPGWITDQPANYYWDNSMCTYFVHNTNTYPGYYPNRYAGKTMDQPVGSFQLRWDIQVTQCDWSSGLYFGVWDSSLEEPWGQGGEFIMVVMGRADGGRVIGFQVCANGAGAYADIYPGWSLNGWYTFKVSYDSDAEVAHLEVLDKLTGAPIWNSTLAVPGGGFTKDLQFLGSNLGMVGRHGYSGISSSAVFNANLDNIVLSVPAIGPVIPPIADAGDDLIADANEKVTLDGSASSDPDGQIIKYTWKRLPDGVIIYSGSDSTCQTKALGRVEEVIELTVTDNSMATATDTVKIINRIIHQLQQKQNKPPVANAGPDQTAYVGVGGIARVTLDGSGSLDPDGQPLTYRWSWTIGNRQTATGPKPVIGLPAGQHTIELVVNDGIDDSKPDQVVVTVIAPIEAQLWVFPEVINRTGKGPVLTLLRMPEGIAIDDIDSSHKLRMYPGEIEATVQHIMPPLMGRIERVRIIASFDKEQLMNAISQNGDVVLQVAGQLVSGQYFFGYDTVTIIEPGPPSKPR